MRRELGVIYQSGEPVSQSGVYIVAGIGISDSDEDEVNEHVRKLRAGELFPNYKGRGAAWHLLRTTEPEKKPILIQTQYRIVMPWQ